MLRYAVRLSLISFLFLARAAFAQTAPPQAAPPTPESLAAATELVKTMNMAEQFKAMFPILMNALKPLVSQLKPEAARDLDALMPMMTATFMERLPEASEGIAKIYASQFSVEDLKAITAFYRSPAGVRMLQKTPQIATQSMALGQAWGKAATEDMKARLIEEMRKKGHTL